MARPQAPREPTGEAGARAAARIAWGFLDRGTKARMVMSGALASLTGILEIASLLFLGPWLVQLFAGGSGGTALRLPFDLPGLAPGSTGPEAIFVAAGLYLVRLLVASLLMWWNLRFTTNARVELSDRAFRRFLHASPESALQRDRSRYLFIIGDGPSYIADTVLLMLGAGGDVVTALAMVAALVLLDAAMTLIALAFIAAVIWLLTRLARGAATRAGAATAENAPISNRIRMEAFATFREIVLYGEREHVAESWRSVASSNARARMGLNYLVQINRYILEFAIVLGLAAASALLAVTQGSPSKIAASLALLAIAGFRLAPTVNRFGGIATSLRSNHASLALFEEEMAALAASPTDPVQQPFLGSGGTLTLADVTYRYAGAPRPALDGISLTVPDGSSLALVGPSGAGKTTLGLLFAGLLRPTSGSISVHTDRGARSERSGVGIVPQEVTLIRGSIAENITFSWGFEEPDRARVEDVARTAGLEEVLAQIPDGLDAFVGDAGSKLSAGQRQRIGLARALYRRPSLLILDEATSALDTWTERFVIDAIAALHGVATTVVIAHRLHTVQSCDSIAFLEGGKLLATGAFGDLMRDIPRFRHLVELSELRSS